MAAAREINTPRTTGHLAEVDHQEEVLGGGWEDLVEVRVQQPPSLSVEVVDEVKNLTPDLFQVDVKNIVIQQLWYKF